jgi:hypothetical protein
MPDEFVMATSCPLCLGADEVPSMVTVEIDRIIPKGRVAIMICRSCTRAVIEAATRLDEPLPAGIEDALGDFVKRAERLEYAKKSKESDDDPTSD